MSLGMWRKFPVRRAEYGRMLQFLEEKVEEIFKTEWTGDRSDQESSGIRVLDVGTGSGASTRILTGYLVARDDDLRLNSEVHTVDKDPKPARDLKEQLNGIRSDPVILKCTGLAQDLQCSNGYFDIVLFFQYNTPYDL